MNRTARWVLAMVLVGMLGTIPYVVTTFFTREHQIDHIDEQIQQQQQAIDALVHGHQEIERRIVVLETQLETMQESSP